MMLQVEAALTCVIGFICIQQCLCDEFSTASGLNKWTCICSTSYQENQSYVRSNCSASCDCSLVAGAPADDDTWRCVCAADGLPKLAANSYNSTCFTGCNCTSGSVTEAQDSTNHISSKDVVIILLLCIIFTTLVFLAAVICYVFNKDKHPAQPRVFSSDRETSFSSATHLISHKASSVLENKFSIYFPISPVSGCFGESRLYGSKKDVIYGTIIQFSYSELENATDKFSHSNLIGLGGSSYVYRGQLKYDRTVAVKRLKAQQGHEADSLFSKEVEMLSRLHHCHVVPLLGYCSEFLGSHYERLLVFEYMPNGNLRDSLNANSGGNIDWETRVKIAIGAARGLEYLHEAAAPRILHRDVKSTNILLDENWSAKITDLGMAKLLRADGNPSSSSSPARMQGTFGYFAPEYAMVGRASLMSDVFSFGVVLLELITGRQPTLESTNEGEQSLVLWAIPRLQDSRRVKMELPDPRLKGKFPEEEMQIMAYLAKECLLLDPDARPTMREIVQILSTISPDKSRRINLPVNLFQMAAISSVKNEPQVIRAGGRAEDFDADELQRNPSIGQKPQDPLPLDSDHTAAAGSSKDGEADIVSTDDMERLILLSSNAQTRRPSDDEPVDLTEPRFESFCMANVKSP